MDAEAIAREIQEREGWSDSTLAGILLEYIGNQQSPDALRDHLEQAAFDEQHDHTADGDCDPDPETGCCRGCGVEHGDPCPDCGGRAYHRPDCPASD